MENTKGIENFPFSIFPILLVVTPLIYPCYLFGKKVSDLFQLARKRGLTTPCEYGIKEKEVATVKKRWEESMLYAWSVVCRHFGSQRGAIGSSTVKIGIFAAIAFVLVGIAANFIPTMMEGWESARTTANASEYTGYTTVIGMAPTLIVLGFVIAVAVVAFLGIKVAKG